MNEREAEKYVKKDNIRKKPDYQSMLDEGIPLGVVYFMKKARDSLNASPQYFYRDNTPEKRHDRQKQYIETVRELQDAVEDAMRVCDRFFLDHGYLEKANGYGGTPAYQGTLAIFFGSRGSENAAAHYGPLRKFINLKKMHRAGSSTHEWWYGLNYYLGGKVGVKGFLLDNAHLYPPMKKLIDAMKFKTETPEQAAKRAEAQNARLTKQAEAWADSTMKYAVDRYGDEAVKEQYVFLKVAFVSGEPGSVDKLSELKKTIRGHVIPKSEREQLQNYEGSMREIKENPQPTPGKTPTDYYRNSKKMGETCERDSGYW